MKPKFDIFSDKFEMSDIVYNTEKKKIQMVLSEVPLCKRELFGMPKMKRCYICASREDNSWTVELGKNLRHATVSEML